MSHRPKAVQMVFFWDFRGTPEGARASASTCSNPDNPFEIARLQGLPPAHTTRETSASDHNFQSSRYRAYHVDDLGFLQA